MTYTVQVKVMPLKELLDPQGKAVMTGLKNLGLPSVSDVRIGRNIQLQVDAESEDKAKQIAEEASRKLLANEVMEYFEVELKN
jgi:phosphoribosylformylglycinamidine synthase subunit PurS